MGMLDIDFFNRRKGSDSPALVGLCAHICSDILDVFRGDTLTECRHCTVTFRDLRDNCSRLVLAELLKSLFLQLLVGCHGVPASCMARGTTGSEDGLSVVQIRGECCWS